MSSLHKGVQRILEEACTPQNTLDDRQLSDFLDSTALAQWSKLVKTDRGRERLVELFDEQLKSRTLQLGVVSQGDQQEELAELEGCDLILRLSSTVRKSWPPLLCIGFRGGDILTKS